jgi:hypothetical protein
VAKAIVLHPYTAENDDELTLIRGEYIDILDRQADDGWWQGRNEKSQLGVFPSNFVKEIDDAVQQTPPPPPTRRSVAGTTTTTTTTGGSPTGGAPRPFSTPTPSLQQQQQQQQQPRAPIQRLPPLPEPDNNKSTDDVLEFKGKKQMRGQF